MLGCNSNTIASFSCAEQNSVRYKQSVASRVYIDSTSSSSTGQPGPEDTDKSTPPASFFYKRAVLRELPYALQKAVTYPYKIARDVKSNQVEACFLSSDLPRQFVQASEVDIALPYRVEQSAFDRNPIDSRFALCLFDFAPQLGWQQYAHLQARELQVAHLDLLCFLPLALIFSVNIYWTTARVMIIPTVP